VVAMSRVLLDTREMQFQRASEWDQNGVRVSAQCKELWLTQQVYQDNGHPIFWPDSLMAWCQKSEDKDVVKGMTAGRLINALWSNLKAGGGGANASLCDGTLFAASTTSDAVRGLESLPSIG